LAQHDRLPLFLRYYDRPSGNDYKRQHGGNYRWDWFKIERTLNEFEIEILADFIQREQGGNIAKIKRHLSWLLDLSAHFVPRHIAMKALYMLFSPRWKELQAQEQMMQFWDKVKPKLIAGIEERLRYGKLGLP